MEKKLRKQENLLVESGVGVILFAVWSVARVNIYLGLSQFLFEDLQKAAEQSGINEKFLRIFMIMILAGVLLWQLSIRLYIGLSANAEGKGKPKDYTYLVMAGVLLVTDLQTFWQSFGLDHILAGEGITFDLIINLCMESASMYVLLELLISGIRVKRMRKKMKE